MLILHENIKHPVTYHESHSNDVPLHTQSVYSLPVVESVELPRHATSWKKALLITRCSHRHNKTKIPVAISTTK